MSVVSSRSTSSISSILKKTGFRNKLIARQNRVTFQLPKNLKKIIINYETECDKRDYAEFICILRDAVIKDNELMELLSQVRECISLLGLQHKILVEALLAINWTDRSPDVTTAYKIFLEDLISVHIDHCKLALDKLVSQFKPISPDTAEWSEAEPRPEDETRLSHIHNVISKFLKIVPMSSSLLVQALSSKFPYMKANSHTHEIYIHSLLKIIEYAPELRLQILSLIINKLLTLDVHAPRSEITSYNDQEEEEEDDQSNVEMFEIDQINDQQQQEKEEKDEKNVKIHPIGHTLDVCMKKLLLYIKKTCYHPPLNNGDLNVDATKSLYFDFLNIFEKAILPTFASHHVQFIMFYITSFKIAFVEAFLNYLWLKASNPNVAPIIRQSAVAYIASLMARGNFVTVQLMMRTILDISNWINNYIETNEKEEETSSSNYDPRIHTVFYSICQALFYTIAFRCNDLMSLKNNLILLENLKLNKIINSKLNPLKYCLSTIVDIFSKVTNHLQIAYCASIIERNSRTNLPVILNQYYFTTLLDTFFPFDAYVLKDSGKIILPLYKSYEGIFQMDQDEDDDDEDEDDEEDEHDKDEDNDNDDFTMDCISPKDASTWSDREKFSFSTSPGFLH